MYKQRGVPTDHFFDNNDMTRALDVATYNPKSNDFSTRPRLAQRTHKILITKAIKNDYTLEDVRVKAQAMRRNHKLNNTEISSTTKGVRVSV